MKAETRTSDNEVPSPRKRARTGRVKETPLSEVDWIEASMDTLVDEPVSAIRIDSLCRKLGVTKGSFYWHFKSRTHLLTALLKRWHQRMTTNVIKNVSKDRKDPSARLRALLSLPRQRAYIAYSIMMGDSVLRQSLDQDSCDAWLAEVVDLLTQSASNPPRD